MRFLLLLTSMAVLLFSFPVFARAPSRTGKMAQPSGLQPVFPDNARCVEIASPYGSQTRYDGSRRPKFRYNGRHGGIDLSLPEGTPLLALADGTVANKGKGGQMEGIYLWLQHAPANTGLSYWIYSKYQHLQTLPELGVGDKVVLGQVIAHSGKTGTTGGYYGSSGYPHLHLSIMKSPKGKYQIKNAVLPAPGSSLVDPLLIFYETRLKPKKSSKPAHGAQTVLIPYMTLDGQINPQGALVVWPVACQPR
jgi:murein DD-endopeptidase MepM/ murein hydrolase activator NlpD